MPAKKHLATITVGAGGAASIEFTSIPQVGTDLFVVLSGRNSGSEPNFWVQLNGSASSNTTRYLYGSGNDAGASASNTSTSGAIAGWASMSGNTASSFGSTSVLVPNYSGADNKGIAIDGISETNGSSAFQGLFAGTWSNAAAVTSVKFTPISGTWAAGSTASLYMFTKGSGGASVA